jgi:hypothetical protein
VLCTAKCWAVSHVALMNRPDPITATSMGPMSLKGIQEDLELFSCSFLRPTIMKSSARRSKSLLHDCLVHKYTVWVENMGLGTRLQTTRPSSGIQQPPAHHHEELVVAQEVAVVHLLADNALERIINM